MTLVSPVRYDRLQEALITVVEDAVTPAQVAWSYGQGVFDATFPSGFVNITMLGGPTYHNQNHARGSILIPPTSVTVKVNTATAGVRYIITVNHFPYS